MIDPSRTGGASGSSRVAKIEHRDDRAAKVDQPLDERRRARQPRGAPIRNDLPDRVDVAAVHRPRHAEQQRARRRRRDSGSRRGRSQSSPADRVSASASSAPRDRDERRRRSCGSGDAKLHRFPGHRMPEAQPRRMQEMSPRRERNQPPAAASAVGVVADDRMADRREMHADLMRAPGVQVRPQQVHGIEAREPHEVRSCRPSGTDDRHALSVSRVARDRLVDRDPVAVEVSPAQRRVPPDDLAPPASPRRARRCARSVLATSSSPDVSLSRRWTMPSRSSPPTSDSGPPRPLSAFTSVPLQLPGAGCTTIPAGLSTTSTSSSSNTTMSGIVLADRPRGRPAAGSRRRSARRRAAGSSPARRGPSTRTLARSRSASRPGCARGRARRRRRGRAAARRRARRSSWRAPCRPAPASLTRRVRRSRASRRPSTGGGSRARAARARRAPRDPRATATTRARARRPSPRNPRR